MHWVKLLFLFLLRRASTLELDDVQYDRMPPIAALDDFHKCLVRGGTYCYVVVDVFADPPNDLMNMITEYSRQYITNYNHSHLERGVCVTDTCRSYIGDEGVGSAGDLHRVLASCLNDSFWKEYELQASVASQMCTDKEQSETIHTDLSDWILLLIVVAILAVNLAGTLFDAYMDDEAKNKASRSTNLEGRSIKYNYDTTSLGTKIVLCFSLRRNWTHLTRTTHHNDRLQALKGIHALRTAGAISIISAHAALLYLTFIGNPRDYEKAFSKLHYTPILHATFIVHVFFTIASFLLVYNLEIAGEKRRLTWKAVPLILTHRFFRMIPPLLLAVLFPATWMRHMGAGPLWGKYVLAVSDQCRAYWWTHLLFINNYVFDNQLCNIPTWHLAADTQLFFLGLVVYLVVQGKPRLRNLLLLTMFVLGIVFPALHVYWYDLDAAFIFQPEFMRFFYSGNFNLLNILAHTNMASYAIGMYTGYKVTEWQRKGVSFNDNKKIFYASGPAGFVLLYFVSHFHDVDTPLWIRMLVQASIRPVMSVLFAILITGLAMRVDGFRDLYEWDGWVIFGKTNYSVYLINLNIVHILLGLQTYLVNLHFLPMLMVQIGVIGLSYLIAIPVYLMVEAPMNPVLKLLVTPAQQLDAQDSFLLEVIEARKKAREENQQKELRGENTSSWEGSMPNGDEEKLKQT